MRREQQGFGTALDLPALARAVTTATGVSQFEIFGGAALALLVAGSVSPRDIDIAIQCGVASTVEVLARIFARGGTRGELRRYRIGLVHPVLMVDANVDGLALDVNMLADTGRIGCFDLDSVRWRFPGGDLVDPFDARHALVTRVATLIRPVDGEDPYLLLTRFLRLASKYSLDVTHPTHVTLLEQLGAAAKVWEPRSGPHHAEVAVKYLNSVDRYLAGCERPESARRALADSGVAPDPGDKPRVDRRSGHGQTVVGIVIPALNEADWIATTIDSIVAQARSNGTLFDAGDVEVVVVSSGSTDDTDAIVAECDERYARVNCRALQTDDLTLVGKRVAGMQSFLDRGIRSPRFLISADADTWFPAGWLDSVMTELAGGCELVASSGWFEPELWQRCPDLAAAYADEVGTVFFDPETTRALQIDESRALFSPLLFELFGRPVADCGFGMTAALYEAVDGFMAEQHVDGTEILAVGWPLQFRADAIGARTGWCKSPGYVTSPRRLLNDPRALFDGTTYLGEMAAFRSASSRHEWLNGVASRLNWDDLRTYVIKNYVLLRCVCDPERVSANTSYFGSDLEPLRREIADYRHCSRWWSAGPLLQFATQLTARYGSGILARRRAITDRQAR